MRNKYLKILIVLAAVMIPIVTLLTPHLAHADCGISWSGGANITDCIFLGTSWIAELCFSAAGALLTIAGVLLNGTMVATLNMKTIVDATPAIGIAWRTLRDFSSIFIIFLLLYASIKMILGMKDAGVGKLIKNIIIAGLLINFSLFITKFAIDTSNIVSLSFYNAIAPGQTVAPTNDLNGLITSAFNDGGLSNVFMQSLSIQSFAGSPGALGQASSTDPNKNRTITLAYAGGTVLMVFAAFSFLFAAIAFAVRIAVLILLMAFSPIYFIALVLPKTKEYSDKWLKTLISMCLFLPVYLLLMYVALSVIKDPNFFNFAKVTSLGTGAGTTSGLISAGTVGIVLQYIIAFLFINAPMLAAIKIGSEGTDIAVKWGENARKWGQGFLGQHTIGRASRDISDSKVFGRVARALPNVAGLIDQNVLSKGAKATFGGSKGGYDARFKKYVETTSKLSKKAEAPIFGSKAKQNRKKLSDEYAAETEKIRNDIAAKEGQGDSETVKEVKKLKEKLEGRKVDKKDIEEEVEKKLKKEAQEEFAKNLVGGPIVNNVFFATKKARKDAAEKIRKDLKKSKEEKALDALREFTRDEKEDREEKGKDKGKKEEKPEK